MLNYGRTGPVTTGALLNADPALQGTTMGIFAFIGFAGALVGPVAFGAALEAAGGREDREPGSGASPRSRWARR